MAFDSTPRRRFGVALGVVLTGVAASLVGFTGVASAHTPKVSAECKGDTTSLKVDALVYPEEAPSELNDARAVVTSRALADIAEVVGCGLETVRSRLRHALSAGEGSWLRTFCRTFSSSAMTRTLSKKRSSRS